MQEVKDLPLMMFLVVRDGSLGESIPGGGRCACGLNVLTRYRRAVFKFRFRSLHSLSNN